MDPLAILKPAIALALWTLLVLTLVPIRRIRAIRAREVSPKDFKLGESNQVPEHVALPNRNIINLFQLPVLFYLACVLLFVTKLDDLLFLYLAWAYVILRIIHSVVHISYNNVLHRFLVFAVSTFVLLVIWLRLAWVMS